MLAALGAGKGKGEDADARPRLSLRPSSEEGGRRFHVLRRLRAKWQRDEATEGFVEARQACLRCGLPPRGAASRVIVVVRVTAGLACLLLLLMLLLLLLLLRLASFFFRGEVWQRGRARRRRREGRPRARHGHRCCRRRRGSTRRLRRTWIEDGVLVAVVVIVPVRPHILALATPQQQRALHCEQQQLVCGPYRMDHAVCYRVEFSQFLRTLFDLKIEQKI